MYTPGIEEHDERNAMENADKYRLIEAREEIDKLIATAQGKFWTAAWRSYDDPSVTIVMTALTTARVRIAKSTISDGLILDEGQWQLNAATSNPSRGYKNYERVLTLSAVPNGHDRSGIVAWLTADHCPGWTGVVLTVNEPQAGCVEVLARTTCDSSD